jgi:hypothetical protein
VFLKPGDIKNPEGHPAMSKKEDLAEKCVMCHGEEDKTQFCTTCHHGAESNWTFDAKVDWTAKQHASAVETTGVGVCTAVCHTTKFCVDCHSLTGVIPSSHDVANFTYAKTPAMTIFGKEPAKATAGHALQALKSTESCEVCHGDGGINAAFCKNCHGMDMPHEDQFKKLHSASNINTCRTCHGFNEVCSSCHHIGATATSDWMSIHGQMTNKHGSDTCVGLCHEQKDCVDCHQSRNIVPASHDASDFVGGGAHVTAFKADAGNCLFCHPGDAATLANSKFCKGCHGLDMPHPGGAGAEGFAHSKQLADGTYKKATCMNCHAQRFCDACHHPQSVANKPWYTYHAVIASEGANARDCYKCHQETYCAYCHVRVQRSR